MPPKAKSLADRFWGRVVQGPGCWGWTGQPHDHRDKHNYGELKLNGRTLYAHRISWELHNGPIPAGMRVLHRCDNPPCSNPEHLFLGTQADNLADMAAKGRSGQRRLTEADVRAIRDQPAVNYAELGRRFGVSTQTIRVIRLRRTWKHVA